MKTKNILHTVFSIIIALYFINAGYGKLSSSKLKSIDEKLVLENILKNDYSPPTGYRIVMNTFKQSGFLAMVSVFQIFCGLLIIFKTTRIIGLFVLLPIIFNIFFMHVFFDDRIGENIVTGILLLINILLCLFYFDKIKLVLKN